MAKINQPVEELRERICIDMEEWWSINKYESNTVIVNKEPTFEVGTITEIAGEKQGELASVLRIGKKTASETLKYLIREFPRWEETTKEIIKSAKAKEAKYEYLKKLNREFMLAF